MKLDDVSRVVHEEDRHNETSHWQQTSLLGHCHRMYRMKLDDVSRIVYEDDRHNEASHWQQTSLLGHCHRMIFESMVKKMLTLGEGGDMRREISNLT